MATEQAGLAVRCDATGRVLQVMRDTLGLTRPPVPGSSLGDILADQNEAKLQGLLGEVAQRGIAFDWIIDVETALGIVALRFAGASALDGVLVMATASTEEAGDIFEQFASANSDLADSNAQLQQRAAAADSSVEELTSLNSSLVALQRHVAREYAQIESNQHFLETILETTPSVIYVFDVKTGRFVYVNSSFERLLNVSFEQATRLGPRDLEAIGASEELSAKRQAETRLAGDGQTLEREYRVLNAEGEQRLLASREKVFARDDEGVPRQVLGVAHDITESRRAENALHESEESYRRQFIDNSTVMLRIDPIDGQIVEANDTAVRFYGYPREQLVSMRIDEIAEMPTEALQEEIAATAPNQGERFDYRHRLADGTMRNVDVSTSRIQFHGRRLLHYIIYDITEHKRSEAELEHHASTDSLTQVSNRRVFLERAAIEIHRVSRHGRALTLVTLDLDDFKGINDTWGHAAGDKALIAFADACGRSIRDIDLLARFGGDEFVLLLPETDLDGARRVAERVQTTLIDNPVLVEGQVLPVGACAGISRLESEDRALDRLLARSDQALYRAKNLGRGRIEIG